MTIPRNEAFLACYVLTFCLAFSIVFVKRTSMDMSTQNLAVNDGEEPVGPEEDLADWEAAEGIPRAEDPFIQKYFQGRDALFTQEDKHRSGS